MKTLPLALLAVLVTTVAAQTPVELGKIAWLRDFEAAQTEAAKRDRPLLVLFQEVPG